MVIDGRWYSETELEAYIATLKNKNERLEEKHLNECRQISEYQAENQELKSVIEKLAKANSSLCFAIGESGGCDYCPYGKESPCEVEQLTAVCDKLTGGKV